MTLEEYQEITGITVPANQITLVTAQLKRTQRILETLLGFTLDPELATENLYIESGKTAQECACPDVDAENLLPPDEVEGAYRLYPYEPKDKFFYVDPFSELHKIKLVKGNVTIKTFEPNEFRVQYGRGGLSKYIENCQNLICSCTCTNCVQLAVDADWLWTDGFPDDLLDLWADMVTYNVDCKKNVKSETIGPHSYTKFDKEDPAGFRTNLLIIKRYAGPYGAVNKVIV